MTDPVRALVEKWRSEGRHLSNPKLICSDELEAALAQQPAAVDDVRIPRELAERVQDALGRFTGDEGWGMDDMDTADDLSAALAAQPGGNGHE